MCAAVGAIFESNSSLLHALDTSHVHLGWELENVVSCNPILSSLFHSTVLLNRKYYSQGGLFISTGHKETVGFLMMKKYICDHMISRFLLFHGNVISGIKCLPLASPAVFDSSEMRGRLLLRGCVGGIILISGGFRDGAPNHCCFRPVGKQWGGDHSIPLLNTKYKS